MRFRDDIDLDKTWVVSDTHFGHENIVGFCHRPEEHEQVMIAEWRAQVPDDATVLHLGDLSYKGNARFKHITAKELTGKRKLLIKGNHDKQAFKFYKDSGFKLARPFALVVTGVDADGQPQRKFEDKAVKFVLGDPAEFDSAYDYVISFSHYAWSDVEEESRAMFHYDWRIHGHIHNNGYQRYAYVPFLRNHINMSVEQTKYRPVNLRILLEAAILGSLPGDQAREDLLAEKARQRSILLRTVGKPG
jgi:calcineurin-like phosphoesterase family protein